MQYTIQDGLVLETVCGVSLLVATMEARHVCPYLTQLNEASAFVWSLLLEEKDTEEMLDIVTREYGTDRTEASETLHGLLDELEKQHYINRKESE